MPGKPLPLIDTVLKIRRLQQSSAEFKTAQALKEHEDLLEDRAREQSAGDEEETRWRTAVTSGPLDPARLVGRARRVVAQQATLGWIDRRIAEAVRIKGERTRDLQRANAYVEAVERVRRPLLSHVRRLSEEQLAADFADRFQSGISHED